jgi:hypothetical protein
LQVPLDAAQPLVEVPRVMLDRLEPVVDDHSLSSVRSQLVYRRSATAP